LLALLPEKVVRPSGVRVTVIVGPFLIAEVLEIRVSDEFFLAATQHAPVKPADFTVMIFDVIQFASKHQYRILD
jgi:hypothetical protein